jgi:hypothetical protein
MEDIKSHSDVLKFLSASRRILYVGYIDKRYGAKVSVGYLNGTKMCIQLRGDDYRASFFVNPSWRAHKNFNFNFFFVCTGSLVSAIKIPRNDNHLVDTCILPVVE